MEEGPERGGIPGIHYVNEGEKFAGEARNKVYARKTPKIELFPRALPLWKTFWCSLSRVARNFLKFGPRKVPGKRFLVKMCRGSRAILATHKSKNPKGGGIHPPYPPPGYATAVEGTTLHYIAKVYCFV